MKNRILICNGTSGISAGAEKVAKFFKEGLKHHNLEDDYDVVVTGDRGLFRDVLVDIVPPDGERITYEYVTPEDVSTIVEEHLVKGEPVKKKLAGEDYQQFFAGQTRIVLANCGEIDPESIDDYLAHNGYKALQNVSK
jgi:NADH-quinone oxidoreductase subunit F